MNDFAILVFGYNRPLFIAEVLKSLKKQNALKYVNVWLDGHQGASGIKKKVELVKAVVGNYAVNKTVFHNGNLGFRKLILQALSITAQKYRYIMVLEDDCFPTRNAVKTFQEELKAIEYDDKIFSIYGHHFGVKGEGETCTRFQGWGWGTTSKKLLPYIELLIDCYSLPEKEYLEFVNRLLTNDVIKRLNVTPNRQPTDTLRKFFAWDETLALLTAINKQTHKKTPERTIYNFGASSDSTRFDDVDYFLAPPYNMIKHEKIWDYF